MKNAAVLDNYPLIKNATNIKIDSERYSIPPPNVQAHVMVDGYWKKFFIYKSDKQALFD